jgi:hypothetical protein
VSCGSDHLCVIAGQTPSLRVSTDPTGGASAWVTDAGAPALGGVSCVATGLCARIGSGTGGNLDASTDPSGGASAWSATAPGSPLFVTQGADDQQKGTVSCASASLCIAAASGGSIIVGTPASATGSPGAPPTPTPAPTPAPKPAVVVSLGSRIASVSTKGVARFEVDCRKSHVACAGILTVTLKVAKTRKRKAHTSVLGHATFTVAAGQRARLNLHLATTARSLIRAHHGRLHAIATFALTGVKTRRALAISLHRG